MLRKTLKFSVKNDEIADMQFAGYGSTWDMDDEGDIINRGAFADTVASFLKDGFIAWQHDWATPIGRPIQAHEDDKGLFIKAQISDTAIGRDAVVLMKDGVVQKLSIGFDILDAEVLDDERGAEMFGEEKYLDIKSTLPWWVDGVRIIKAIKLYEVSPVSLPANPHAVITDAKNGSGSELPFNEHLLAVGSAVEGLKRHLKYKAKRRKEDGRELSDAQLGHIKQLIETYAGLADDLRSIAEVKSVDDDAIRQEIARFHANSARLVGAL